MRLRLLAVVLLSLLVGALAAVWAVEREVGRTWLALGVHPEVIEALADAMRAERRLAELDPAAADAARLRFARLERLHARLQVVSHSQAALVRRAQWTLVALVAALLAAGALLVWLGRRRTDQRLEHLRIHLAALASGASEVATGERGGDAIARVARMVEETARAVSRERRQAAALAHLGQWQQAARRQVHELRTPLTGAALEIERLRDLMVGVPPAYAEVAGPRIDALEAELKRLRRLAEEFAGFARLREPRLEAVALGPWLAELVRAFDGAWPGVTLTVEPAGEPVTVAADRELLRQAVVNLLDNAARAGARRVVLRPTAAGGEGALAVADDGPGLPDSVRERLFEPYNTTRKTGEGLGLGLAIARKIALDHGGDLTLAATDAGGTTFAIKLPLAGSTTRAPGWDQLRAGR